MNRPTWDEYFLRMAGLASTRSTCLKRQVGAVVAKNRMVLSTGYNDTPRGVQNCGDGGCPRCAADQDSQKFSAHAGDCLCIHAEQNVIIQAAFHGVSIESGVLYITLEPCFICAKLIINAGINEVVYSNQYPGYGEDERARIASFFSSAGVTLRYVPLDPIQAGRCVR